jgi:hypothetical protein
MVKAWYKTHPTNKIMSDQIENWIQTCDLLSENQHFNEQKFWKVPTFQPWYNYDAYLCLQQYFHIKHRISDPKDLTKVARQQPSTQKNVQHMGRSMLLSPPKEPHPHPKMPVVLQNQVHSEKQDPDMEELLP